MGSQRDPIHRPASVMPAASYFDGNPFLARKDNDSIPVDSTDRNKDDKMLGWYSTSANGDIGDIPMNEAGANLRSVMVEVGLVSGGTAPIQLMWSNAVGGPEGPFA